MTTAAKFVIGTGIISLIVACYVGASWWIAYPTETVRTYVGGARCATCHQSETAAWKGSHHDLAMQEATPANVLGDFQDAVFEHFGVASKLFRRGDEYWVNTEGADGELQDFRIRYTFGVSPLQQYLVEFPDGRLQVLPLCWDVVRKRWFHIYQDEPIRPGDVLHWTGYSQTWNHMCAECHSTDLRRGFDAQSNRYATKYSQINVGCEACHGPGSLHVEMAEANSLFWDRNLGKGLAVTLKDPANITQVETCARCHARGSPIMADHDPGDPFFDHKTLNLIDGENYYDDGQIRDEVFEHGSFLQSKMFRKNIKCTDCHDPHTAKTKHIGNQLCVSCHQHPAGKYDTPAHTHHAPNSTGSSCVDCHMPQSTYMVIHRRRDHSIRVPRPDLSVKLGVPNACNQCHDGLRTPELKDKTPTERAQWAAGKVVEWYGPKRAQDPHYGEILAAARKGDAKIVPQLIALCKSKDVGPNVRASAVTYLLRFDGEKPSATVAAALESATTDVEAMVRLAAVDGLRPQSLIERSEALLTDAARAVRMRAAHRISTFPPQSLPTGLLASKAYLAASREYLDGQRSIADTSPANIQLGGAAYNTERYAEAEKHFHMAQTLTPQLFDAVHHRVEAMERAGRAVDVDPVLRKAIADHDAMVAGLQAGLDQITVAEVKARRTADIDRTRIMGATLRMDLALKLSEKPAGYAEAEKLLRAALDLDPNLPRAAYNLAELLRFQQRDAEAEPLFRDALKLDPNGRDALVGLSATLIKLDKAGEAETLLKAALNRDPDWSYAVALADVYAARREWEPAEKLLTYSYERFQRPELMAALARIYRLQNKNQEAARIERQLQESAPRPPGAE